MVLFFPSRMAAWLFSVCLLMSGAVFASSEDEYLARAESILSMAVSEGSVSYSDVVSASYGQNGLAPSIIEAKQRWREASASLGFTYQCDYGNLRDAASVEKVEVGVRKQGTSYLVADYEASRHLIRLSRRATGSTLYHEAGHSLQRDAICRDATKKYSKYSYDFKTRHSPRGTVSKRLLEQYRYLSMQDELEVRLQDLNRAHAFAFDEGPIMDERDTLRTLAAMGFHLDFNEVAAAFEWAGRQLEKSDFVALAKSEKELRPDLERRFRDARELVDLRRLAIRIDAESWPRLFAKILFEAPGHL